MYENKINELIKNDILQKFNVFLFFFLNILFWNFQRATGWAPLAFTIIFFLRFFYSFIMMLNITKYFVSDTGIRVRF